MKLIELGSKFFSRKNSRFLKIDFNHENDYLGDIDAIIAWNVLVSNPACNGESQAFGTFEKLNIKEFFIGINELWLLAFDIQFHSVSRSFQTFDSNTMADIDYINVIHSAKKKNKIFFPLEFVISLTTAHTSKLHCLGIALKMQLLFLL